MPNSDQDAYQIESLIVSLMGSRIERQMQKLIESEIGDLSENLVESLIESQIGSNSELFLQQSHIGWSSISRGIFGLIESLRFCTLHSTETLISDVDFELISCGKSSNRRLAALYTFIYI